jgi:two-component system, OmpR family, phosphate regulon sensor histidine kinase PhoR
MKEVTIANQTDEIESLRQQLEEANAAIEAIRTGQVDAFVVEDKNGPRLYTLKSADQTYRLFIEKMTEGAITVNKQGVILYCNSRFAAMLDIPLKKMIGSYFKDYIPKNSEKLFDKLIRKGWKEECKDELCLISADGKFIPVLVSLTTLDLDEGTVLSLIFTDLTGQKQIEKQLREKNEQLEAANALAEKLNNELEHRVNERTNELLTSREHFKFLADTIPVIVWTALPNGDLDYFNTQWYNYSGLTFEKSVGKGWQSVIHAEDFPKVFVEWNKSLISGEAFKIEARIKSAQGVYRCYIMNALPFKDNVGNVIRWFGVCTDIEDQKKDMEKKDEFISMASHELKTPVTTLKAYTEILLMEAENKDNKAELNMLEKMDKQINKLTSLIGDLLDVSKSNSGQLNLDIENIDFNQLVKEVISAMQLTVKTHSIELNLSDTDIIKGDKNRLGQVITNLVSNAVKYSQNANKIIISSEHQDGQIKFCVKDFGIGIPLSQQPKLFNRFFRVSKNTYPGLGLGLYICNEIIKRHCGKMDFKSEEGEGSTFCFYLPIKR